MDQEDLHDIELKRELNRRYAEDDSDHYEARQRRKRLLIQLGALLVVFVFFFSLAGNWLKTFQYPSLSFIWESWELSRDPQIRELRQAVVRVEASRSGTVQSPPARHRGTGFNIEPSGVIVTNRHLVEAADQITVSFSRDGRYLADSWYWSETADLAVIILKAEELPAVHADYDYTLTPGETVTVIGNPLSYTGIALRGQVEDTGQGAARIGAPIHPGHSGSPVFNEAGHVVGVVFAAVAAADPENPAGLAVLLPALRELLVNPGTI